MGCGREVLEGGDIYIYLWLIHVDVWQKPTQYCKAIIFQLKINKLKLKKRTRISRDGLVQPLILLEETSSPVLQVQTALQLQPRCKKKWINLSKVKHTFYSRLSVVKWHSWEGCHWERLIWLINPEKLNGVRGSFRQRPAWALLCSSPHETQNGETNIKMVTQGVCFERCQGRLSRKIDLLSQVPLSEIS